MKQYLRKGYRIIFFIYTRNEATPGLKAQPAQHYPKKSTQNRPLQVPRQKELVQNKPISHQKFTRPVSLRKWPDGCKTRNS